MAIDDSERKDFVAVLTERGIEWLYPVNDRILIVK